MDIMELGAIGELVGGVAVIASLLYVGRQLRQSAAATRLASTTAVSDGFNQAMAGVLEGDIAVLREALNSNLEGLTREQRFLFGGQMFVMYSHLETVFYQSKGRIAEAFVAFRLRSLVSWFQNTPGVQTWWYGNVYDDRPGQIGELFSPEFQEYVRSLEVSVPSLSTAEA